MLQTYIPHASKTMIKINEKIAMDSDDEQVVFFTSSGPVYSYRKNDKFAKRLVQALIVTSNLAKYSEVASAIGVNQTTVSRNVKIYKDKGPEGFIDDRSDRSAYKFSPKKQRVVKRLLDKGSTIVAAAAEVGVSEGCVRTALRNGTIVRKDSQPSQSQGSTDLKGPGTRSLEAVKCKSGIGTRREIERTLASKGQLTEAAPEFSACEGVSYAGVLIALPFLTDLSYLKAAKRVYGALRKGYYGLQSVFLTFAFMALLRIKNPEQLKNCNPVDFGIILGLDRSPEVKTLRKKLKELAAQNKSGHFIDYLSRSWVDQDEDLIGFVYIDGHVRPYHGRKHTLPKTHVARRRLCMPATTDFWVNGSQCEPLLFITTKANNSLLSTVNNDILPELKALSNGQRITLVFDREGWSPDQFFKWRESGVDVITYRKGNYEPWPHECFMKVSSQIRGKKVTYMLGERSIQIKKKGWFREVRRLCDNGHQTSIVTTRQDLSLEEIARRMFFRWNQENYFKYMREEYNLDHLVSRGVEPADIERMVPNPSKKEVKKERTKKLRQLKTKKEEYATKAANNDESRCRTMRGFNISNSGLKAQIRHLEKEVESHDIKIKQLPDKVKIKEILSEDKIISLETESKRLTDSIKMSCYRAETELVRSVEQAQCFSRSTDEGRNFIKSVFRQPADIIPNHKDGRLEIRFHTMSTNRENNALKKLCEMANMENFEYPGTGLKLVFSAA